MKKILGISAFFHDSAACVLVNGTVVAAAQEERFSRIKNDAQFPVYAITYCLHQANLSIDQLDAVVFYDKPFLKFERILENYYAFAPQGVLSFIKAMPSWIKQKIFIRKQIKQHLKKIHPYNSKKLHILFSEHHLSHACSAFFASEFKQAVILTIDGVGEWATASIAVGKENTISTLKEMHYPHSLGLFYSAFTYYLGFKVNEGEYKVMGLAPYGNLKDPQTQEYIQKIKDKLVHIKEDGSIWMDQNYYRYATHLNMVHNSKWEALLNLPRRTPNTPILKEHKNLALAIQTVTEEIVLAMATHAQKITGAQNLCLAGGVALNAVANGKLAESKLFQNIFIQPAAGDAGNALGAAYAAHHLYFQQPRNSIPNAMQGCYLGPSYTPEEIENTLKIEKASYTQYAQEELNQIISQELLEGKVVAWFQDRMEFGPRALGNRSILANPLELQMQSILNQKIKFRESFRPFAPVVLEEDAPQYFNLQGPSPHMLLVSPVKEGPNQIPLPAITHVNKSARLQTLNQEQNPKLYALLKAFKAKSGVGILVNTSFNVKDEPIVCSPKDAYHCFMHSGIDILVLENYLLYKEQQTHA